MSSTAIEAPRADPTGIASRLAVSDTVTLAMTEPRARTLTLDQRLAVRHQLCELRQRVGHVGPRHHTVTTRQVDRAQQLIRALEVVVDDQVLVLAVVA